MGHWRPALRAVALAAIVMANTADASVGMDITNGEGGFGRAHVSGAMVMRPMGDLHVRIPMGDGVTPPFPRWRWLERWMGRQIGCRQPAALGESAEFCRV